MNLNDEIITKGFPVVASEITNKIRVYKYITVVSLILCLVFSVKYSTEAENSKAKSSQLQQKDATIIEKLDQIKLLEELNINLSKTQ